MSQVNSAPVFFNFLFATALLFLLGMRSLALCFASESIETTDNKDFILISTLELQRNTSQVKNCTDSGTCNSLKSNATQIAIANVSSDTCREYKNPKDPNDNGKSTTMNGSVVDVALIFSSDENIKLLLDEFNTTQIIQNDGDTRGLDYHFKTNTMFWYNYKDKAIYRERIENGTQTEAGIGPGKLVIMHDMRSWVSGIAVDWIHGNIYWTDSQKDEISVSNLNGTMKKVLMSNGLSAPASIVVNPLNGWMHWVDSWDFRIERAGMDASGRQVLLTKNTEAPQGLTIDLAQNRLYWTYGYHPSSIWSSNFDGSDQKPLFKTLQQQFVYSEFGSITTFGDSVFWLDSWRNTIYKANKCNGSELAKFYKSDTDLKVIKVYDASAQPDGENFCSQRIGQCSHFCLPGPGPSSAAGETTESVSTSCACPDGLRLSGDKLNCR